MLFLAGLFSVNFFGQNILGDQIRQQANRLQSGDTEAKRDALHKLRAAESAEASRIAAEGLTDKIEIVRATAPFSVLSLPADEAAESLLPQLKDKSAYVRRETAYALGATKSVKAAAPLAQILASDKDYSVRCSAALALGLVGEVSTVPALIEILQKKPAANEEFLRRSAARSIGQIAAATLLKDFLAQSEIKDFNAYTIGNRKNLSEKHSALRTATVILINILNSPNEADDTKREAVYALGEIGSPTAIPILTQKISAEDYYLAENARRALQKINSASEK